jgi:hypothetical protein
MDEPVAVSVPEAVAQIEAVARKLGISAEPTLAFLNLKSSGPTQNDEPVIGSHDRELTATPVSEPIANRAHTARPDLGRRGASKEAAGKVSDPARVARRRLFVVAKSHGTQRTNQGTQSHRVSAWERFIKNKELHQRYAITRAELGMLSRVAMMGEALDTQDFLFILDKIRGNAGPTS